MTSDNNEVIEQYYLPIRRSNQVIVMGVDVVSTGGNANEHIDVCKDKNRSRGGKYTALVQPPGCVARVCETDHSNGLPALVHPTCLETFRVIVTGHSLSRGENTS